MKKLICAVAASVALLGFAPASAATTNMLFILDGSNSMWGQVDGVAKIETAKQVLGKLLSDLPAATQVGLVAYGHRLKGSCEDVEMMSGIGERDPQAIVKMVNGITPRGKTPISFALDLGSTAFAGREDENNNIVLISDGIETCKGDPCATTRDLMKLGINVRVHTVGFNVDEETRAQLRCIADAGNGSYFDADSTENLQKAMVAVQQVAQAETKPAPPSAPKPKELTVYFEDQFDGDNLADDWEVINPNPDGFIVDHGTLLAVNSMVSSFDQENVENLFVLDKELPKGDWTMTAKLNVDFQTGFERVFLGLYGDKGNYLVSELWTVAGQCDPGGSYSQHLNLSPVKATNGALTQSDHEVAKVPRCDNEAATLTDLLGPIQPILLRLEKKGRSYFSSILLQGTEDPKWITLPPLTSLRSPGKPALGVFQTGSGGGETLIKVDWIKIEVPE